MRSNRPETKNDNKCAMCGAQVAPGELICAQCRYEEEIDRAERTGDYRHIRRYEREAWE